MEKYKSYIIKILRTSLENEKFIVENNENVDWEKIFFVSDKHRIISLIYYVLDRKSIINIEPGLLANVRKNIFKNNIIELNNFNFIKKIILELKHSNIEVIVLKGIVLRDYYPLPELRTMSDYDILVKEKDYEDVKKYLLSNGFIDNHVKSDIHHGFISNEGILIEVHSKLIDKNLIKYDTSDYERSLWEAKIPFRMGDVITNTLSTEDFIIHLCFHMEKHALGGGFGLRQLYDLAVFINKNNKSIRWDYLIDKMSRNNILNFSKGIFIVLNKYFGVCFPKNLCGDKKINNEVIDKYLNNIIESGVYGKYSNRINFIDGLKKYGLRKYFYLSIKEKISCLFPNNDYMSVAYPYVKNSRVLLPIAWTHRFLRFMFRKEKIAVKYERMRYYLKNGYRGINLISIFKL